MAKRPTVGWRGLMGLLFRRLWPRKFAAAVDAALDTFDAQVASLPRPPQDAEVWAVVKQVVLALNAIDEVYEAIETDEREDLCEYIDAVLTEAGIDVPALAIRDGRQPHELTDQWREW